MRKIILVLLLPLLFFSCANIKDVQCTGVKGFKVNKISTEGINSEVMLTIKNPNHFGFALYPSEFDILYGGVKLGKAKLNKKVYIARDAEQAYPFELAGDFKGISLTDVMKVLESFTRKGVLEAKGNLKVGKWLVRKSFPVDIKEKISIE